MTFSAKKLKLMKCCLLHCKKTVHFIRKNTFCSWALLLKLHLATFSDWERSFWASVASYSHQLLSCTKHRIVFLEALKKWFVHLSSKMTFSAKKLKLMKCCLLHCKKQFFIRKNTFSCSWALLLKLHLATFSDWERSFWASVASHSHYLLSCTKHRVGVLRSSKEVFLCI